MGQASYKQFCPVAMAAELLCTRWTVVLLRELVAGSTRFNELRRGVPRMSSALLAKRLKELEAAGIIRREPSLKERGVHEYLLTEAGTDLRPVIESVGLWGQKWVQSKPSLENLDASLLMWDMRRNLNPAPLPDGRCVIEFLYAEQTPAARRWWLIIEPKEDVDLCSVNPGFEVDVHVATDLRTMTSIWMGLSSVRSALLNDELMVTGPHTLVGKMQTWLGLSPFACEKKVVD